MIKTLFCISVFSFSMITIPRGALAQTTAMNEAKPCAVVLHGLGRTSWSMRKVARRLQQEGYTVWNRSYPSTRDTVEELTIVIDDALLYCEEQGATPVYFVTHSLGGILVRHYFQTQNVPEVKGVVMLAPPNKGSEVVDAYKNDWWFRWSTGPAGQQLGTDSESIPNSIGTVPFPVGVIAGTVSSDPWFSHLFSGPHDGKVSVESAALADMTDFITVSEGHTFIMNAPDVLDQIVHFLRYGIFQRDHQ